MTKSSRPTNLVSLDQRRRACRVLRIVADLLGGGGIEEINGIGTPVPGAKHLPRLGMDIATTRDTAPAHMRAILAFARRRRFGFVLIRFRDPAPGLVEALFTVVLWDTGLAVLDQMSLAANARRFWLAGTDIHLRITKDGFVPTLTDPWTDDGDRESFVSKGDQILSEYVWRD